MTDRESWASETLREAPFWRDDMQPEEYDAEREYLADHWPDFQAGGYLPLWKQKDVIPGI